MKPYTDIPDLREVVLEESFVLAIVASPGRLEFSLEVFVTERHPAYRIPRPKPMGNFVAAKLEFSGVRSLTWVGQGARPATDASGEFDFGHIDGMTWESESFELEGEWGRMLVVSEPPTLTIT